MSALPPIAQNPQIRQYVVFEIRQRGDGAHGSQDQSVPTHEYDDTPAPSPSRASLVPARCGVVEHVRRRALVWPDRGPSARFAQWIATGLPARVLCHLADHMPVLRSDVRDVV